MEQVSALMHDQIDQPLDRAIYWIEYVIRHRGAPHLRNSSRDLFLLQRGLVDVILAILAACLFMVYVGFRLCGIIYLSRFGMKKSVIETINKKAN